MWKGSESQYILKTNINFWTYTLEVPTPVSHPRLVRESGSVIPFVYVPP